MRDLTVRIHHEDGSYWSEVDELPGCFASGRTMPELIEAIEEAVAMYLSEPQGAQVSAEATSIQIRVST